MKRTRLIFSGFTFVLIGLCIACDKDELIYDLPHEPTKVVVNFPGVNDAFWAGTVSLSHPILKPFPLYEQPAGTTVKLFEDGTFLESLMPTQWENDNGFESKSNSPRPGHTYMIEVTTQDYGRVTSTYVQPSLIPPTAFEFKKLGPIVGEGWWPEGGENVSLRVSFKDPPGEDFYDIQIKASWEFPDEHRVAGAMNLEMIDPPYRKLENKYSGTTGFILDDKRFDGQEASFLFKSQYPYRNNMTTPGYFWVEIRHLSPEYYKYLVTELVQINTSGDPYAQPTKVFTNIEGGYGVFGGFSRTLTRYKTEE